MSGNSNRPGEPRSEDAAGAAPLAEHAAGLYRYVRFLVGDSPYVEDIVQETMVRALGSIDRYDPQRPLRAWLNGIALHVTHKYWRRVRRARNAERAEQAPGPAAGTARDPEQELLLRERADLLYRALDALPDTLREALVLHAGEQLPAEEVAQRLGTTTTNIYTRVSRARAQVRAFLEAERRRRGGGEGPP
ncbi:MAG: RNA polymerase sigma factor [Deltaproteobacteria bacterium]|nr:RNA polymerase sigma factor [Deltaproteobacteria bacterium]